MSSGGAYDPRQVEPAMYELWERSGAFDADPDPARQPFTVMMPPPNVTGALHLGHAMYTVQDLITRYRRMCGDNALYLPGTDHAGIATQAVVERRLREEEGLTRKELGREGLVERIWQWKEEYGARILSQLRRIGCSSDWRRTRFTLDATCARAVYHVFHRLYRDGLIFRGPRMVNWDTQLQTAVADDEINYETVKGSLWHIRYPIEGRPDDWRQPPPAAEGTQDAQIPAVAAPVDAPAADPRRGQDYLVVATTRPETMLGDTAVAVHPEDERYRHLIGRYVILPLMNRRIPIIADPILVSREFGTGCVKVTPAHDPNDYECGKRHSLVFINILTPDGFMNSSAGGQADDAARASGSSGPFTPGVHDYRGLSKSDARKRVVADLERLGYLERVEPYETQVGHSDRSKSPIEPMISEQWFVRCGPLAELAMEAVRDGRVRFYPSRYAKGYLDWLSEKRDWCISRQLWWGHRIPVWSREMPLSDLLSPSSGQTPLHALTGCTSVIRVEEIGGTGEWHDVTRDNGVGFAALRAALAAGDRRVRVSICAPMNPTGTDCLPDAAVEWAEQNGFERDPDVLDTWFSSALWPFSTLGWPHVGDAPPPGPQGEAPPNRADFDYFFPTSVLCTARDIISLWVARMVMLSLYFTRRVPFSHVYINPTIQDGQGRRMSKSLGNGVDPLDLIDLYGADALRVTLAQLAGDTQDLRIPVAYACPHCAALTPQSSVVPRGKFPIDVKTAACSSCKERFATAWADAATKAELGVALDSSERFEQGRNFCTKLWQAATGFVIPNLEAVPPDTARATPTVLEDRWLLSRLRACIEEVTQRLDRYQFSDAMGRLYDFFWAEFCDWYVEFAKPRLSTRNVDGASSPRSDASAAEARAVLSWGLDVTLRMLHPAGPFITEALWQRLGAVLPRRGAPGCPAVEAAPLLVRAPWPGSPAAAADAGSRDPAAEREMEELQGVIRALRDVRTRLNAIRSATRQPALRTLPTGVIRCDAPTAARLQHSLAQILRLGQTDALAIGPDQQRPAECFANIMTGIEVFVPVSGLADLGAERARLAREREEVAGHAARVEGKLSNAAFAGKAPAAVIEAERARLAEFRERLAKIDDSLRELA
ncbi:MAG: valine--tRNA ligase [Planctomycetia bacterium]|nr:MAG: valine--tRNA ligase [Planctomycetia bacterium]